MNASIIWRPYLSECVYRYAHCVADFVSYFCVSFTLFIAFHFRSSCWRSLKSLKWNIIHTCSYDSHLCINECMRGLFFLFQTFNTTYTQSVYQATVPRYINTRAHARIVKLRKKNCAIWKMKEDKEDQVEWRVGVNDESPIACTAQFIFPNSCNM